MGVFVAGSSRSPQTPAWAGVGRVGRCLFEAAARQDLFLGRGSEPLRLHADRSARAVT
jgi:hypothetical protein